MTRHPRIFLLILLVVLLAACNGEGNNQPATTTPAPSPESTDLPIATTLMECNVVSTDPTPDPTLAAIFPPVGEKDWVKGPADAAVTIVNYMDFQ